MNIVARNSRLYLVNLLSDFIMNKIPSDSNSIIEVVDCENFYVVKGKTTSKEIIDLNKVKDEFLENNPELKNEKKLLNTIDLIDYNSKVSEINSIKKIFYNSETCQFHQTQVDSFKGDSSKILGYHGFVTEETEGLIVKSNFPFGHSLRMGRLLYYLAKHLVYNIQQTFLSKKS